LYLMNQQFSNLTCFVILLGSVFSSIILFYVNYSTHRPITTSTKMTFDYYKARRDDSISDDYHGTKISDPYRWMEDPDAKETKEFVDAQNEITMPFLQKCQLREKIHSKTKAMWNYGKYSCPSKRGSHYFYYHNSGLQNQSVLYIQDSLDAEPRVFLDPNTLSEDGTTAISGTAFSENGQYFAYGLSNAGSDWVTIKFRDVESEKDLPDILEKCKFTSMAWTHDQKGLFYNRYLETDIKAEGTETSSNINQKLFYHRIGTDQSEDVLVAEFPEQPKWMIGAELSDCGQYLILYIRQGCDPVNQLYYTDLKSLADGITGILSYVKVVDNFDAEYDFVTNEGPVCTFKTNLDAPRYRLINIDLSKSDKEFWTSLIAEQDQDVLEWASCVNQDTLILCYLHDVKNVLYIHDLVSGDRKAELPLDIGSVVGYSGKKKDTEIFYQFMSFLTPSVIFRCDMSSQTLTPSVFREISVTGFDPSNLVQNQVFYTSKDGTKIPMFIVHRKDLVMDGSHPVLLYGYGGFNIPITPTFSISRSMYMLHLGGVLAIANIRGGGEYGETWHKGGIYGNKQNVFDDFISAAEYLVSTKYTKPSKIVIQGGSNGGLLVGACANQRPDLFGAVINQVGVMDMLRFHKFTIGHAWTTDFGCSEKEEDFKWLIKYSPLHNIAIPQGNTQYPSILLLTADHDDRVVPSHSLKYIAQMQHVMGGVEKQINPLLIRVDTKAGHGAGKPTAKLIEEVTDIYCFIAKTVGLEWHD